jgi:hypothetical protein
MAAGQDVFARRELNFNGAFTADTGLISGGTLTGVLMQSIGLNYQQQISRIYDLGTAGAQANVYYIGGRSSGNMNVAHVVGPALALQAYYTSFSDVCQAGSNNIAVNLSRSACGAPAAQGTTLNGGVATATVSYKAKYCVLVGIGMNVGAQDLVIQESSNLTFANLEFTESGGPQVVGDINPPANPIA